MRRFMKRRLSARLQAPLHFESRPIDPASWEWADEVAGPAVRKMAEVALPLFENSERWIHRRVERIRFIDRETIHRQVSVDFTLPTGVTPVGRFENRDVYIAPLFLLSKDHPRPLRIDKGRRWWAPWRDPYPKRLPMALYSDVTFIDETGKHIPLLTRRQSNQLASAMLQKAAADAIEKPLLKDQRNDIATLVFGGRRRRWRALNVLLLKDPTKGPDSERTELGESESFVELACMMAAHSPVVCLFTDGPPGRSIVKISYVEPMDDESSLSKGRIRRSIGWKSEYLSVRVNEIGAGAGHHLEVDIPEDLQINSISLAGKRYVVANKKWRDLTRPDKKKLAEPEEDYSVHQVGAASRGNVYMSGLPYTRRMGRLVVKLRARRSGFLLGALAVSIIMTVVLGVLALVADNVMDVEKSSGSMAALLLFPSVVAAYIARPGEHIITARMLRWARIALICNAALPFLAVLCLLTTPEPPSTSPGIDLGGLLTNWLGGIQPQDSPSNGLQARWAVLAGLSALFTCLFVVSNIWPRPHGKSHYRPIPAEADGETAIEPAEPSQAPPNSAPQPASG